MTVEELNRLVESAYEAAFEYEDELASAYQAAFRRASLTATRAFKYQAVTAAAFVAPPLDSLTSGMTPKEQASVNRVRDQAAEAIAAALTVLGLTAVAVSFMEAISQRGELNFDQELLRVLRTTVEQGLAEGWTADETALAIQRTFEGVSSTTATMLAQTELTTLVNERSLEAAQKSVEATSAPLYKRWQTMRDARVRPAHATTEGQTVPISQPFNVGGYLMMYPGDPSAPMTLVARCRCRMTYTESLTAAATGPDVSSLAMIAVYPTQDQAEAIAVEGGQEAATMHVTMVFLGEASEIDMDAVVEAVQAVSGETPPMSGQVGGIGMFSDFGDGFPQLAIPNVQGLSQLRTRLTDALAERGVVSPSEHDWVPHMTLAYVDEAALPDDLSVLGRELSFDTLSISVADVRTDFPFAAEMTASGKEDTMSTMSTVTITVGEEAAAEEATTAEPMADGPAWRALLAVEEVPSEDGRMLAEGSLTWRDLPLTLTAMDTSQHGAEGEARVAGRIDRIWRDGLEVWGEGVFNTDEFGTHIYELVSNQSLRGNSIEPAVLSYEVRNRETGEVLEGEAIYEAMLNDVPLLTVFLEAVIMCSTVVATPALADANIILAGGILKTSWCSWLPEAEETLTASAAGLAPLEPPLSWFEDPRFTGPTPLTVTKEGRVMGHAALWNSCHIGEPNGPGICVPPPRSGMQYEIFHHGVVTTEEGVDVPCGQITMSTLHAGRDLSWRAALDHYENSGCAVADVVAGEDRFGIWVTGGLRPDLPAERVRELKAGSLSGDWRDVISRGLEFLAALVVNIPGFPIPRPEARIVASAAGEEVVLALVAAGMVTEEDVDGMSRQEYLRKIGALTR